MEDTIQYGIPITHGRIQHFRKSNFQGHAAPVNSPGDIHVVVSKIRSCLKYQASPIAFRVSTSQLTEDGNIQEGIGEEGEIIESSEDSGEFGAGDKLLRLLQNWDVRNVVVVVTREDFGKPDRLGNQRFRIMVDCAKQVLEQCFLDSNGNFSDMESSDEEYFETDESMMASQAKIIHPQSTNDEKISPEKKLHGFRTPYPTSKAIFPGIRDIKMFGVRSQDELHSNHFATEIPIESTIAEKTSTMLSDIQQKSKHYCLSKRDHIELKSMLRPRIPVYKIMKCVAILLNFPDHTWAGLREMISWKDFREIIRLPVDISGFKTEHLEFVKQEILCKSELFPDRVRQISIPAGRVLEWVVASLMEYVRAIADETSERVLQDRFYKRKIRHHGKK